MLLDNHIYDNGLSRFNAEANQLRICNALPATYAAATGANSLGTKTAPAISTPQAGDPNGRQVTVSAFSDGTVDTTGTGTHYAIVDTINSRLLAAEELAAPQAVTAGNTFSLDAFTVRIPAPV